MNTTLLSSLNPMQYDAVTLPHASALIVAGAGSGKTRVLTSRVAWLIETGQISPYEIMAVTFTNKASREMVTRLSALSAIQGRGMWVGTFHGLCHRMLRTHSIEAQLPQTFQILDRQDQLGVVRRVLRASGVSEDACPPKQLQSFINARKDEGMRAAQYTEHAPRHFVALYAAYEAQCQRDGVVDFSELLLRAHELLSTHEALRVHYQQRFRHILVDEFQDTSRLQYDWLKQLAGPQTALFVVGDDDQSIYAFRGAHVGNLRDFERQFNVKHCIRLEQNYRSLGNILDAANALISHNQDRLGKQLWTEASAGEPIHVLEADHDEAEAERIVTEVATRHRAGEALSSMAVLYRSNAQSRALEHQLFARGTPYRVYGGLRFFERQEIKHALAYLRLIVNRDDDNAWLRVVNTPPRGIGLRTIAHVQELAQSNGTSIWDASCTSLPGRIGNVLRTFVQLIDTLAEDSAPLRLSEKIRLLIDRSGLRTFYQTDPSGKPGEGIERLENLEELIRAAIYFERESDAFGVDEFLAHASLEAGDHQADDAQDALQLMTAHSAKGLEFDTVFICGLEEGLFPHEHSLSIPKDIEEERRLLYVAITRARRHLYLSLAAQRLWFGQVRYQMPSRFLLELPQQLLDWPKRTMLVDRRSMAQAYIPQRPSAAAGSKKFQVGHCVRHPKFGVGRDCGHRRE